MSKGLTTAFMNVATALRKIVDPYRYYEIRTFFTTHSCCGRDVGFVEEERIVHVTEKYQYLCVKNA